MPSFINPLIIQGSIQRDKTPEDQKVDILDFETVRYDKSGVNCKRSLSLNVYQYDRILALTNSEESTRENTDIEKKQENVVLFSDIKGSRKPLLLASFALVASICSLFVLTIVTFKVFENGGKGNLYKIPVSVVLIS